jgi:DNA-binding transcriptional LysR family regulator
MIELRLLEHALALRDQRSFRAAARAVHLSQPALTRSIQSLEEKVGVKLFERSRRAVLPTAEGLRFLEKASAIVRETRDLQSMFSGTGRAASGEIAVGAGPYAAEMILGPVIAEMLTETPQVGFRVSLGEWITCIQRVRSRDLDLCIAETSQVGDAADLIVRPLAPHQGYFVVRAGHPLVTEQVRDFSEVVRYPLLSPTRLPPRLAIPLLQGVGADAGVQRPFPAAVCDPPSLMRRIVLESDAVGMFTLPLVERELRERVFRVVPLTVEWLHTRFGIFCLKDRDLLPACREAMDRIERKDKELTALEAELRRGFVAGAQKGEGANKRTSH